uniref:C2 domain-containing protein n=1 Tax=Odontella aurita TaxID=265563 RepID=A0A7S4I157_9STRA
MNRISGFFNVLYSNLVYKSDSKNIKMDLDWSKDETSLLSLCGGDFDAPIEFDFFQKREREFATRKKHIGSAETTVNDLMVAAGHGKSMIISKDGERRGEFVVLQAECFGFAVASKVLTVATEAKELSEAKSMVAASKLQAAELVKEEFEKAHLEAEAREKSERLANIALAEAEEAAKSTKAESLNAAGEAERIRKFGFLGTLKFQFVGKELANVERLQFIGKSDPFFVLQKVESEEAGRIQWSTAFVSPVVMDDLNPTWEQSSVEVNDLCSTDLYEPIRVVVFDWEKNGKHRLIGHFDTTVHNIISAQEASVEIPMTKGKEMTGRISVPYAELVGLEDQMAAENRAKELAEKADKAHFFALGARHRAKHASITAKRAQNVALEVRQTLQVASEEATKAMRIGMEKTVTHRLEELGLDYT